MMARHRQFDQNTQTKIGRVRFWHRLGTIIEGQFMQNQLRMRAAAPGNGRHRRPSFKLGALFACLPALLATTAWAAENDQIVTDRPDFVESSNVVGTGRFQIETSLGGDRNKANGVKERSYATPTLLRYGVSDTLELRLETDGRIVQKTTSAAGSVTERGYGDVSLGLKWHAVDAEGNLPSIGWLLHADLDSGSRQFRGDGVRPSLRVAAEWELPNELSLGVMPGIVYKRNAAGERYVGAVFGVVLDKAWNQRLRSFVELSLPQIARAGNGGSLATFDIGGAYLLSNNWQIDAGLARGLNKNTPDLVWTVGLSTRF
jgi:hypothetical protein